MSESESIQYFVGPVLRMDRPRIPYHFIPVPSEIAEKLVGYGTRRVIIEIRGHSLRRCLFTNSDGEDSIMVNLSYLRDIGAIPGDIVEVTIWSDPNPDTVDLCDEFRIALDQDEEAATRYFALSVGKRRSIAHYPNSAKRVETRIKRALEICHKLRTRTLHADSDS